MKLQLDNKVYDTLKWIALIGIPAVSVLYVAIANIWGLPFSIEVAATLDAIAVFIGAIIGVSTKNYKANK